MREGRPAHGTVGCNRLLARLQHMVNWAIAEAMLDENPFKRGGVTVVSWTSRRIHGSGGWSPAKKKRYSSTPARTLGR